MCLDRTNKNNENNDFAMYRNKWTSAQFQDSKDSAARDQVLLHSSRGKELLCTFHEPADNHCKDKYRGLRDQRRTPERSSSVSIM